MYTGKIDFGDETAIDLKKKWGKLLSPFSSVNIPKGWVSLVEIMLKEVAGLRGKKQIDMMNAEWGNLEVNCWVTRPSKKVYVPHEILQKFQQEAHQTCYECGGYGGRVIIENKVYVACRPCHSILESNPDASRTGTWLDQI